jgi:hypothetical protein
MEDANIIVLIIVAVELLCLCVAAFLLLRRVLPKDNGQSKPNLDADLERLTRVLDNLYSHLKGTKPQEPRPNTAYSDSGLKADVGRIVNLLEALRDADKSADPSSSPKKSETPPLVVSPPVFPTVPLDTKPLAVKPATTKPSKDAAVLLAECFIAHCYSWQSDSQFHDNFERKLKSEDPKWKVTKVYRNSSGHDLLIYDWDAGPQRDRIRTEYWLVDFSGTKWLLPHPIEMTRFSELKEQFYQGPHVIPATLGAITPPRVYPQRGCYSVAKGSVSLRIPILAQAAAEAPKIVSPPGQTAKANLDAGTPDKKPDLQDTLALAPASKTATSDASTVIGNKFVEFCKQNSQSEQISQSSAFHACLQGSLPDSEVKVVFRSEAGEYSDGPGWSEQFGSQASWLVRSGDAAFLLPAPLNQSAFYSAHSDAFGAAAKDATPANLEACVPALLNFASPDKVIWRTDKAGVLRVSANPAPAPQPPPAAPAKPEPVPSQNPREAIGEIFVKFCHRISSGTPVTNLKDEFSVMMKESLAGASTIQPVYRDARLGTFSNFYEGINYWRIAIRNQSFLLPYPSVQGGFPENLPGFRSPGPLRLDQLGRVLPARLSVRGNDDWKIEEEGELASAVGLSPKPQQESPAQTVETAQPSDEDCQAIGSYFVEFCKNQDEMTEHEKLRAFMFEKTRSNYEVFPVHHKDSNQNAAFDLGLGGDQTETYWIIRGKYCYLVPAPHSIFRFHSLRFFQEGGTGNASAYNNRDIKPAWVTSLKAGALVQKPTGTWSLRECGRIEYRTKIGA